jgi:hypothetical protein
MYLRIRMEGSVYYITINVYGRLNIFNTPSFIIPILDSLNFYRHQFKRKLLGYVIMLDHMSPVRAEMVDDPAKYAYSSCRNYEFNDNTLAEIDKEW